MKKKLAGVVSLFVLVLIALIAGCGGDDSVTPPAQDQVQISGVSPSTLALGAQGLPVQITGSGFVSVTSVDLGSGISIASLRVSDPNHIDLVVNVSKTAAAGPHTVTVVAASSTGTLAAGLTVSNNFAPIAKFTVSPTQGTIHTPIVLDASGSTDSDGTIKAYNWQFSDGTTSTGKKTEHKFTEKGNFTISLRVTDDKGAVSAAEKGVAIGDNAPPVATFTFSPEIGTNQTPYTFDASGSKDPDGSIRRYGWDFGDKKTAQGVRVIHQYKDSGNYDVQLTVTDDGGVTTSVNQKVSVIHGVDGGPGGCRPGLINQTFQVLIVDGKHVTVSAEVKHCHGCADLRRPGAHGLLEFAGDIDNIRGNTFDYSIDGFLPGCKGPQEGEILGVVWKGCK